MPCLNCGKPSRIHRLTGIETKYCSDTCMRTYATRAWRHSNPGKYLPKHAEKMRMRRASMYGPKRPRDTLWRGVHESTAFCLYCGREFQRTRQPNPKVYCTVSCRAKAKKSRENPGYVPRAARYKKPKPKAPKVQKCSGCPWRVSLFCQHPGLPVDLHDKGSVSIRESGKCPLQIVA